MQYRRRTSADLVRCVFGEMFKRTPILTGKSDLDQIQIIFDMVGSPNDQNMPGWHDLPGCEGIKTFDFRPGNLREQFPQ
jgi:serine/threonine-protein kinase BUR1